MAVDYYEGCQPGLGTAFTHAVDSTIARICEAPSAWPPLYGSTRRCPLKGFPYGVVYVEQETRVLVLAVMHLHRRPGYWLDRLRDA